VSFSYIAPLTRCLAGHGSRRILKPTLNPTARQLEDILKADHPQNWKDLEKMARLVEAVRTGALRNAQYVLPVQSLGNLERIEKLSKTIRARMERGQACCLIY
jgi:hypothetical protein